MILLVYIRKEVNRLYIILLSISPHPDLATMLDTKHNFANFMQPRCACVLHVGQYAKFSHINRET